MTPEGIDPPTLSRRDLLRGSLAAGAALVLPTARRITTARPAPVSTPADAWSRALQELDAKIEAAMQASAIPGAAVGVSLGNRLYLRGYGVTSVSSPTPVGPDTVFRIQSSTKPFTGTALMRLVDQGRVALDAPVRRYLPDFSTVDAEASAQVTVRQLVNHSAGWLGDYFPGFDQPDGALAQYVASMRTLPQLTRPGTLFAYSNAAICVAGRIVEVVTGSPYAAAVQNLVLEPLRLTSSYFSHEPPASSAAVPHLLQGGKPVVDLASWDIPRSEDPTGGLISSVRDQMRWARFHLGDGASPDGDRLLTRRSLLEMRSRPGPGGTLLVELNGMGVTWWLRPSAEGELIVQHGGSGPGQLSGFLMVPSRRFALTLLTNSDGAAGLRSELFAGDWALRRFAGVSNLPARTERRGASQLRDFRGTYVAEEISNQGVTPTEVRLRAEQGRLQGTLTKGGTAQSVGAAFYRGDYTLDLDGTGRPTGSRSNFVRRRDGSVAWWRKGGRLYRHLTAGTPAAGAAGAGPDREQP